MTKEKKQEQPTELDELKESLARVQADYANYRRRTEENMQRLQKTAAKDLIQDLLNIIDNLELALKQVPKDKQTDFYKGVELIFGQLISQLEENGVKRITEESFDPLLHEAILSEPSDKPKGTIIETLQSGYVLDNDVLRTAKVKVSAGVEENT